jgi:glucosamine kinase
VAALNRPTFCIDAGGSRCRGRLIGAGGAVLASAEAGPCNPSTDLARAVASLRQLWQRCAEAAGRDPGDTETLTLAIGGAGLGAPAIRERFLAQGPRFAHASVMSDGYAALIGAGGGAPCALIIVGTGIAAHRLYPDGTSVLRDGWGWIGGDRGGGAWLGQRALRHCFAAVDGIVPRDPLAAAVLDRVRAWNNEFGGWMVGMGPDRLATLAPLVVAAAARGEPAAAAILARAVDHLAAVARSLGLAAADRLFLFGGLADEMRPRLAGALGRAVDTPATDAITGCWLVATGAAPAERAVDPLAEIGA